MSEQQIETLSVVVDEETGQRMWYYRWTDSDGDGEVISDKPPTLVCGGALT